MSKLNRPTIDGFVEKLLNDQIIKENEVDKVQLSLEQASKGLNKNEIFTLVSTLNDRLDAVSNDLITPNGLNYVVFDNIVKEVSKNIVKEKINREADEIAKKELLDKERMQEESLLKEKEERERQERIDGNKKILDNFFERHPILENYKKTEEEKQALAVEMDITNEYYKEIKRQKDAGFSSDMAEKNAREKLGISKERFNSDNAQEARIIIFAEQIEEIEKNNKDISVEESYEILKKNNSGLCKDIEKEHPEIIKKAKEGKMSWAQCIEEMYLRFTYKKYEKKIDEDDISINVIKNSGNDFSIDILYERIELREKNKLNLNDAKIKINRLINKEKSDLNMESFFDDITYRYLSSGKSVAELYQELEGTEYFDDLEFEDVLNGIIDNLSKDGNGAWCSNNIETIKSYERKIWVYKLLEKEIKDGNCNINGERKDANLMMKDKYMKDYEYCQETIRKCQDSWIKKRGIDVEKYKEADEKKKILNATTRGNVKLSRKKSIQNRNRILEDRKQIKKIANESGISIDDAAKKYFQQNPEALEQYSKRERKILLGEQAEERKYNGILAKLDKVLQIANKQVITIFTVDKIRLNKEVEDLKQESYDPRSLYEKQKELEDKKSKIEKLKENNRKLERKQSKKTAIDILKKNFKDVVQQDVFWEYIKSDKSAVEIMNEINFANPDYELNMEDMYGIIQEGLKKYLVKSDIKQLLNSENKVYSKTIQIDALKLKLDKAKSQGSGVWTNDYEKLISMREDAIQSEMSKISEYKALVRNRAGIKENNSSRNLNEQQNVENKETKSLETENIETDCGIIPNVEKIAQKGNVTPNGIKGMFLKIKSLYNSQKESTKEEQDVTPEEKATNTSAETEVR